MVYDGDGFSRVNGSAKPIDVQHIVGYENENFGNRYIAVVPKEVSYFQIYGFCTAPVNMLGAIIIWRGSTEAMSGYKWHLLNFQIWSTVFEFIMCALLANLPEFNNIADFSCGRFYGLLAAEFGAPIFVCAVFMVAPVLFLFLSIVQCFAYRHQTLLELDSKFKLQPKTFNLVLLIVYLIAVAGFTIVLYGAYYVYEDEVTEVRYYDMDENYDNYYELNPNVISKVVLVPAMSVLVVGMLLVVSMTISSIHILMSSGRNLSAKTKSMQWSFIRVLCIQTGLPILVIVLPLMYRLVRGAIPLKSPDERIHEGGLEPQTLILWIAIHCHGLLTTFTLAFLKPFRDYVKRLLFLDKIKISAIINFLPHGTATKTGRTKSVSSADSSVVA